jgi:hypothetical protein
MSSNTDKQVVLCEVCETLRNVDNLVSGKEFKHHSSYTELCKSADDGCELCQAFMRLQRFGDKELSPNFDEDMNISKTQITWQRHYRDCLVMLHQNALVGDGKCFNSWFEVYTEWGKQCANLRANLAYATQMTLWPVF